MRGYLLPGSRSRAGSFQSPKTLAPLWDFCRHSWIESLSARVYTLAKASEQKHRQLLFNSLRDSLLFLPHFQWNSDTSHFYLTQSLYPSPSLPKAESEPMTSHNYGPTTRVLFYFSATKLTGHQLQNPERTVKSGKKQRSLTGQEQSSVEKHLPGMLDFGFKPQHPPHTLYGWKCEEMV